MPIRWDKKNLETLLSCSTDEDLLRSFPEANLPTLKRRQREFRSETKTRITMNEGIILEKIEESPITSAIEVSGIFSRIVVASDFHLPRINKEIYAKLIDCIKANKPELIVLAGDVLDADVLGRFTHLPDTPNLTEQLSLGTKILSEIRATAPEAKIIFLEGNHCFRLRTFLLNKCPEFYKIPELTLPHLLKLNELQIIWKPVREIATRFVSNYIILKDHDLVIAHADKTSTIPGTAARLLSEKQFGGMNLIQAHTHKSSLLFYKDTKNEVRFVIECGMIGETLSGFSSEKNWINSFVYIENNKPEIIL